MMAGLDERGWRRQDASCPALLCHGFIVDDFGLENPQGGRRRAQRSRPELRRLSRARYVSTPRPVLDHTRSAEILTDRRIPVQIVEEPLRMNLLIGHPILVCQRSAELFGAVRGKSTAQFVPCARPIAP